MRGLRELSLLRSHLLRLAMVLLAVRATVHLRLFPGLPDLVPVFQADPFLTLLDVFSGGAFASGSVLALGVFALVLARPLAAVLIPARDSLDLQRFHRAWRRIAALLSLALGWLYLPLLERVAGVAIPVPRPWAALTLTAGTALALGLAFLLDGEDAETGLALLVTFQILAALPRYLFAGSSTPGDVAIRIGVAIVAAAVYGILSKGMRRLPVVDPTVRAKRTEIYLPLPLNLAGVAPLLWVLAVVALVRLPLLILSLSEAGRLRELAGVGLRLTDLSAPEGWLAFFLVGLLVESAVNWSKLSGAELAEQMRKHGNFIPGQRPGRTTAQFIDRAFARIAWAAPLVTVGMPAAVALAALRIQPESRWPVLLIPVLFTVVPLQGLALFWQSRLVMSDYDGFMKRGGAR